MSASDWGSDAETPKRGVPGWVWWGCGGGCLLVLLALVGLMVLGGSVLKRALDPERAWGGVAELLPHDRRPEGWEALGTSQFGVGVYLLHPPQAHSFLIVQRLRDAQDVARLLEPGSPADAGWTWIVERTGEHEASTLELQGRTARCLRFAGRFVGLQRDAQPFPARVVRIDVTGSGPPTVLHVVLGLEEAEAGDEAVRALLAPFDVWRGR